MTKSSYYWIGDSLCQCGHVLDDHNGADDPEGNPHLFTLPCQQCVCRDWDDADAPFPPTDELARRRAEKKAPA